VRVAPVTMDPLAVPVLLDSRETVVSPVPPEQWDWPVPPDPLDLLDRLEEPETVERLAQVETLDLLELLVLEVPLDPLDPVVRREVLERREREA